MTNEYKENLLKYFVGEINQTEQTNTPVFDNILEYNNNLNTFINNNLDGTLENDTIKIIQGKDGTGKNLDSFILVGTEDYNSKYYGFIVLLDKDLNPIQMIKSYTSGVRLGYIYSIKVADDGTFYFVEYTNATDKIRLVITNNLLVKSQYQDQYFCKIRISYNLPEAMQTMLSTLEVFKNNTGSHYGFIGTTTQLLIVESLKIEVGESNVWNEYIYDFIEQFNNTLVYLGGYCYWNEDDFTFETICSQTTEEPSSVIRFYLSGDNIVYNTVNLTGYEYSECFSQYAVEIVAPNHEYFGIASVETSGTLPTGKYRYSLAEVNGSSVNGIYTKDTTFTPTGSNGYPVIKLRYISGLVFFFCYYSIDTTAQIDFGLIFNGNAYYNTITGLTPNMFFYFTEIWGITIQYNLIKYIMPKLNYSGLYVGTQIFNINNYNGASYEGIKSLLPNSAILYNNQNNIIFARNLYNKMIYNNTSLSTLQIPNTMLNDETIAKNNLLSYNNNEIVSNNDSIEKNIYETVDINYYNVLKMQNRNDINNIVNNIKGAIRVNDSINKSLDVDMASATRVNIVYKEQAGQQRNYNFAFQLNNSQITLNNNVATYDFIVYVPTGWDLKSLNISSLDGNTIYLTIDNNFESGKYYRITQDATII